VRDLDAVTVVDRDTDDLAAALVPTDLRTVYLKQLELIGSSFFSHADFAELVELIRNGRLRPLLAGTYPLEELAQAQADFVAKRFVGKIVITVAR
jgi:NADPH:quinone reductase-like Zn-dependent oxidoreductase